MMRRLHQLLHRHAGSRADRTALFGSITAVINFILALLKIGLGVATNSLWLLIFGGYYLMLAIARSLFLRHYSVTRRTNTTPETGVFIQTAGLAYVVLGAVFTFCAYIMFRGGYQGHFGKITAITVATIGFYKLTMAIVGFIRVRRFHRGPLVFLKTFSLADGAMAIVLTQYALLSASHQRVDQVTGIFGMSVGSLLVLIGLIALMFQHFLPKKNLSS